MASPHQRPPQVGDTTNLLLKKLVTATQDLGGSGGIFLTVAEANALYAKQLSNLSDLSNIATARTNLGLGTGNSPSFNQVTSTVATGTAPFVVASTTLVANLHAATADSTTAASTVTIADDTTTNAVMYVPWVTANTGNLPLKVTSTKLSFNPSTGLLTIDGITAGRGVGAFANNTVFGAGALSGVTNTGQFNTVFGAGAFASSTTAGNVVAIGYNALKSALTGNSNIAIGRDAMADGVGGGGNNIGIGNSALRNFTTGTDSVAIGTAALQASAGGSDAGNTAVGRGALQLLNGGATNTALGYTAGQNNVTGSSNVFIGANAGKYELGSSAFYVDNQDRTNTAGDKAKALLYGTFNATAASQTLTINALITAPYSLNLGGTAYSFGALPSGATTSGPVITVPATTYTVTGTNTATAFQANYFGAPTFTNASVGTITDAFNTIFKGPPVAAGSQVITRGHTLGIVDSTAASSSIAGGFIVATTLGTAATSVGIGGGAINAGGTIVAGTTFGAGGSASSNAGFFGGYTGIGGSTIIQFQDTVTIPSTTTANYIAFDSNPSTAAASFTLGVLGGIQIRENSKGASSAVTLQYGVNVAALTFGTTIYGYRGQVASGANKYNLYMDGTAQNLLAGVTNFSNTTSASSSILGAVTIGNGTAATNVGIGGGNINAGGTLTVGGTSTLTGAVTQTAKTATYNNVATAGWGVVAVYADGGSAANANARAAAAAAYTVGAADGTFVVSGNILINSGTTFSMSLDCVYTDQGNTSRTLVLPLAQLAGTFVVTGLATNVTGTGPYESASMTIRCKAGSTITIRPSAGGTYTTVNYDVYANIRQVG